jgi:hypothetical protein
MIPLLSRLVLLALLPLSASAFLKEAALRLPEELAAVERLPVSERQGWKRVEKL